MVRSRPRPVAVNRVSQENAGAHESKEGGDCFQHLTHPATQRLSEDANRIAQSKGFWRRGGLAVVLMISGNTVAGSHCLMYFVAGDSNFGAEACIVRWPSQRRAQGVRA